MAADKSPVEWALTPLKKYAQFSGRAPRAEFWWFFLFLTILYLVMSFVFIGSIGSLAQSEAEPSAGMLPALGGGMILIGLFWLAVIIPTIAVQVRRLHDTNRSGWWLGAFYLLYAVYLAMLFASIGSAAMDPTAAAQPNMGTFGMTMILGLIMLVYVIVLLVFYILPGTKGDNRFGPDPYGEDIEKVFA